MEKTLPLYLGPSVIGSVTLDGDEKNLHALARTYASLSGICRAYIKSSTGTLLIGVLSPDGSSFSAEHTFTRSTLYERGISPGEISYAYAICKENGDSPSPEAWTSADEVCATTFSDDILSTLLSFSGAKVDNVLNPTKIAVPLFSGRPLPRTDVLCLMTPVKIGGEFFGVIGISGSGGVVRI